MKTIRICEYIVQMALFSRLYSKNFNYLVKFHDSWQHCSRINLSEDVESDPGHVSDRVYLLNFVILSLAVAGVIIVLASLYIMRWSGSVRGQDTDPSSSQWAQEDSGGHDEAVETISFIEGVTPLPHCTLTLVRSNTADHLRDKY